METTDTHDKAQEASAEVVHKAKGVAQAVETARELQMAELAQKTATATKESLLEGLKEVFGGSDNENPQEMKVLVRRIPILCVNIANMHSDIADMKDNIRWGVRIVIGGVIAAVLALLFK